MRPLDFVNVPTRTVVAVEDALGSGRYVVDARLQPHRVDLRSDDALSTAVIQVRLDTQFDALAARQRYLPDLRLAVRTDESDPVDRHWLLVGYPTLQHAGAGDDHDTMTLHLTCATVRLTLDERAQIVGRRMRTATMLDALPTAAAPSAHDAAIVAALPCVFNPGGTGNRAPTLVNLRTASGTTHRIPLFTHDDDPAATSWTLADALRYCVGYHHLPGGPVDVTALLTLTDSVLLAGIGRWRPPSRLLDRLLQPADDLDCEAVNLLEAINLIADRAGVHVTTVLDSLPDSVTARLHLWAMEDQPVRRLGRAWGGHHDDGSPRYDLRQRPPAEVFRDNELATVDLRWDHRGQVTAPIVVGDVRRYEITVDLVPGWLPTDNLDNVPLADRPSARQLAITPDVVELLGDDAELVPWFRRYHRAGSEFDENRDVARRWILNEDGTFDAATYNRNPPFDDYRPFNFTAALPAGTATPGTWTRRPRPMQPGISRTTGGAPVGVYVEISFDAGFTWHQPAGSVITLTERAGIWLGIGNLTAITPPNTNPATDNLWFALVDQRARVRATALFDSDDRLLARHQPTPSNALTGWRNARLVYRPQTYRFAARSDLANVLASAGLPAELRDDENAARAAAGRFAADLQTGTVTADLTIPWLVRACAIGTRLRGIRGRSIELDGFNPRSAARDPRWFVIGKILDWRGGAITTRLILTRRLDAPQD